MLTFLFVNHTTIFLRKKYRDVRQALLFCNQKGGYGGAKGIVLGTKAHPLLLPQYCPLPKWGFVAEGGWGLWCSSQLRSDGERLRMRPLPLVAAWAL